MLRTRVAERIGVVEMDEGDLEARASQVVAGALHRWMGDVLPPCWGKLMEILD